MTIATTVNRDVTMLHPKMKEALIPLLQDLARAYERGETQSLFQLFEGFRHPVRQDHVFKQGTSKARAWQSSHQYGLAADLVARRVRLPERTLPEGWYWDQVPLKDWTFMRNKAERHGLLTPIHWDKPHVEHPIWMRVKVHLL